MKNRLDIITELVNETLTFCMADTNYNDELLKEILTFGFKGFSNMTDSELKSQIDNLIEKLEVENA
jgi:hypothetical protein